MKEFKKGGKDTIKSLEELLPDGKIKSKLKSIREKFGLTVVMTTLDLNQSLYSDYLYIIGEKKILLSGEPITILQRDNIINKTGLSLPFMVDLSVKLRDYDLISNINLDKNRMINEIWK